MALEVKRISIEAITELRPLMARIQARDKSLAQQITRAASSMSLNIAEGELSDPGKRRMAAWKAPIATSAGSALTVGTTGRPRDKDGTARSS